MSEGSHQEERRHPPNRDAPVRVLIVDDQQALCRVLRRTLEREGYEVDLAFDVQSGKQLLSTGFDVVVLDVDLPDGVGFDLVEFARSAHSRPTAIIMMTGNPSKESLGQSLEQGVHEMLFKPFRQSELKDAVSRAVEANERWRQKLQALRRAPSDAAPVSSVGMVVGQGDGEQRVSLPPDDVDQLSAGLIAQHDLTDREGEILQLILQGLQNTEIAEALQISGNTVKYHVRNLLTKLGMESRTELFRTLLHHPE